MKILPCVCSIYVKSVQNIVGYYMLYVSEYEAQRIDL